MPLGRGWPNGGSVFVGRAFDDAALCHAEKANVKLVEALTFRLWRRFGLPVCFTERTLFTDRNARETTVGRISEDDENVGVAFDAVRSVALGGEFGEEQGFRLLGWHPTSEGIG